jgi:type IV pilus assembly protein PilC
VSTFAYEAINAEGKLIKGSLEAENVNNARDSIKSQGLTVVSVGSQNALSKDLKFDFSKGPSVRDLSVFCRQFVSMIRSGVTILDSLQMLGESTENKKLREAIFDVKTSTETGMSLSGAMQEFSPEIFPSLLISMVTAGEASGSLDIAFDRMAKQFERTSRTQALIKKAMIYPIIVVIVAIAVVVVMLEVVIPTYTSMFEQLDTELPALTKAVVAMSDGLKHYWFIIVPVVGALIFGFMTFKNTDQGKHIFGKIAINLPLTKDITVKSASALMSRTLSTLIGAGLPLVEAVDITSGVMSNVFFREALEHAKEEITIGQPLSRPLEEAGIFPPMVYYMIRIGEETGNIEDMLNKNAEYYEEEVEMAVQSFMAMLEPLIIIVLAAIVGVLIGAVMAPMLAMYQGLDNL